ncbi:phospholipase D-like domain-containing protein [Nevskia soli]|uniref:phospholipase D-like domain-containing protein n=1 Tax=Nevskia soli TaxID=418856 RepID=UPI000690E2DA|nr:phospholipase D-like domain-containing protein [Nevskia soli]
MLGIALTPAVKETLFGVYAVAAIVAASHALLHKRDPRAAWGWIAVCWLFPLAGAILYYLFGVNRVQTRAVRVFGNELPTMVPRCPDQPPRISGADPEEVRELVRLGWAMSGRRLRGGNRIDPLHNGSEAYPAMLAAIAEARHTVDMSSYIFRDDAVGKTFAEALGAAQQRGVAVRVMLDGLADLAYHPRGSRLLRRHGLQPALFLPLRLWPPMLHINLRNHRKLLIVDGEIAFTGGMNIQQGHLAAAKGEPLIDDLHFRVRGPLVAQLAQVFLSDWSFAAGQPAPDPVDGNPCEEEPEPAQGDHASRVITEGPNEDIDRLIMVLIGALATAHDRVWFMTPYFLPPSPLLSALQSAALRGIDVSVIIPQRSDQRWMDWATRHILRFLLRRQVKVFLRPPPFAHTKLLIVDDWYVQFGSANLDTRSLRLNFELMVESYGEPLATKMAGHFNDVRATSHPAKPEDLASRRFPARFRDALCWLFSPYL